MPKTDSADWALAPPMDGSSAGELIPELPRQSNEALGIPSTTRSQQHLKALIKCKPDLIKFSY